MKNHPASRILATLELLQSKGTISGAEFCRKLGIARRTVRRYLAVLEEMGVPITTERGPQGGYQLVPGYKLPPMMFTNQEALALSVGLVAAKNLALPPQAVSSARAKLERVMPAPVQAKSRAIAESIALTSSPASDRDISGVLATLSLAAHSFRGVNLGYRKPNSEQQTTRDFDPYGLAHRAGKWYSTGYCHSRRGVRSFRLDRITSVDLQDRRFERPSGFDILAHLDRSIATLPRKYSIEVIVTGAAINQLQAAIFPAFGILEPFQADSVLLRAQADDVRWFARELARLPWDFQILRPAALRKAMAAEGARLMRNSGIECRAGC